MGAVYAGHDDKLDRKVALKVLHADQRLDLEARDRLLREARALSKVDHPNICRIHDYIETGDVDLLVLEYIDGRTLQHVLDEGLPQGEKLRIAMSIAEVLVRAHRAGIVHRDLKPENVMLTKTGEVKVLDFGLARWLQFRRSGGHMAVDDSMMPLRQTPDPAVGATMVMPSARPSDVFPGGRREFLATAAGITLGTPLYMSPEQARGESLTPASDMFSFGLLLQVLFTGKEPHPDFITAREVILRVARGETNPVEGAPKPITALINSLKQFAPTDRPTAVQTVERLQFLMAAPQRIARRSVAAGIAAVMLFGGWRYTVDLQRERTKALEAREDAQQQRAKAEDMVEFILGDLRKKLEAVGRLEVLEDAAQRALKYVDELNPERSSAAELARSSKALNQLVEVRIAQGRLTDALDLANRSFRLTYLAVAKSPGDPEVQLAHGTSQYWLGYVYRLKGDRASALTRWKEYSIIAERLARSHPEHETYQLERVYGYSNLASLLEDASDLTGALEQHRLTLQAKSALLAAAPNDDKRQADLAVTLNKMAWVQHRLGRYSEAKATFERELEIRKKLLAMAPKDQTRRDRLSRCHRFLARTLEALGDVTRAEKNVRDSLALQSELHQLDVTNADWTRNLAMTHNDLSALLHTRREYGSAVAEAKTARELMTGLISKDPKHESWRLERANAAISLARALLGDGQVGAAASALASAREDIAAAPSSSSSPVVAITHFVGGELHAAQGDLRAARAAWTTAVDLFGRMPKGDLATRLHVVALLRLDRAGDAAPLIERLDRSGYRHPEYLAERSKSL